MTTLAGGSPRIMHELEQAQVLRTVDEVLEVIQNLPQSQVMVNIPRSVLEKLLLFVKSNNNVNNQTGTYYKGGSL